MSKKLSICGILILIGIFIIVGCSEESLENEVSEEVKTVETEEGEKISESKENEEDKENKEEKEYILAKDHTGTEVKIPKEIKRPVGLTGNYIEVLFNLGYSPVAKVDNYSIREEAKDLPSVGLQGNINIEKLYEVEPDIIIAHGRHQGQIIDSLRETGIPVFVINPGRVEGSALFSSMEFLGGILGKDEIVNNHIEKVEKIGLELGEEINNKGIKTAIVLNGGGDISAAQKTTGYGSALDMLGLENVIPEGIIGESSENFVSINIESIIKADPDIIIFTGESRNEEENKKELEKYINDPMWSGLKAVENNNIVILPFNAHPSRATHEDFVRLIGETILND